MNTINQKFPVNDCRTACVNVFVSLRNFIRLISHKDVTSCSPRKCLISRITSFSETLKIFKTAVFEAASQFTVCCKSTVLQY